jgi:uncharacterized protein (TIGR02646 family)
MIKLEYPKEPNELKQNAKKLTSEFVKAHNTQKTQQTGKKKTPLPDVWNRPCVKQPIRETLLQMSSGKCCYCEAEIGKPDSPYMEVDHFYPKDKYPDEVVQWENLLPVCGKCNKNKLAHDTKKEPIIHPAKDIPKQYLELITTDNGYTIQGTTPLGKKTEEIIKLNPVTADWIKFRNKLITSVRSNLNDILNEVQIYCDLRDKKLCSNESIQNVKKITDVLKTVSTKRLKQVLETGTKEFPYSAVISTIILTNDDYKEIKALFEKYNLWSIEFEKLEKEMKYCELPYDEE